MTASRRLSFWSYGVGELQGAPVLQTHHETLDYLATLGLPVNPETARRRRPHGCSRVYRAPAGSPPRSRLRDRRRGHQSRLARTPTRAGLHIARAQVGDRVQVPSRRAHDAAARDPGIHRRQRKSDAVRRARTRIRRWVDRRRRDPPQRGSGPGQGRASGRHRDRAQGRRRDPRGGRTRAGRATRRPCAVGVSRALFVSRALPAGARAR